MVGDMTSPLRWRISPVCKAAPRVAGDTRERPVAQPASESSTTLDAVGAASDANDSGEAPPECMSAKTRG